MANYDYVKDDSDFEKLAMNIGNDLAICIANCPDNFDICSFVMKKSNKDKSFNFVRHELNKEQMDVIIDALQKVRSDMDI